MARKNAILFLAALLLALSAIVPLAAFAQSIDNSGPDSVNPRDFLDQFQGRQFPNERPPRDDQVAAQAAGVEIGSAAVDDWYNNFYSKNEKGGANPIAYARRAEALAQAEAQGLSPMAAGLSEIGTAKMLMIPFEFTGTDDIPVCEDDLETPVLDGDGNPVVDTISGPLHGTIPDPAGSGDNNSIWTDDFSIQWYQDLMFGDGVGVIRTDLNGGAGVDLTGVTAKKWYEEQSEGMYTIEGDIYPQWIQLDHSVAYYGWDGDELNPDGTGYPCGGTQSGFGFEFTIDVVNKLNQMDPDFDWAQYDVDGDGVVDHLMVIHAGVDNSAGGGEYENYQLWAHSWDVYCEDSEGNLALGCLVDDGDTPDDPSDDIYVANYTLIPEDADIGVVVHEYGHDIGLPDYYDQTGATSNSTAHWIVMSGGSWSGALGGSHPAPFNPWARYFFGWADPVRVDYQAPAAEYMIGQSEPTPADAEDSVWIDLPDQAVAVENLAGEGKGLHAILGNEVVHTLGRLFDLSATTAPVFSFDTYFAIEEDWDYTYVLASTDGGANWDILLNEEGVYATDDPNGSFAYQGPGGLTGEYEGALHYDLSAYAGGPVLLAFAYVTDQAVQDPGIWVDNFSLDDGDANLYSNDLEDSSDWTNDGWEEVPYNEFFSHYYILEWRNNAGSIASEGQTQQYYSLAHDGDGWMVDKFSANVPGMVVWYRNNRYSNNQAVNGGREFADPATGPKGQLLVVDSHYDPVVWSGGWWDPDAGEPAQEFSNRRGAMDAAFGLDDTPAWMIHDYADSANAVMDFGSRPAVSAFHDSMRSVPGWVFPGDGFVYRADRDSSVVIPAKGTYTTRIRGLAADGVNLGGDIPGFWGFTVGGQPLGPGNPGDSGVQFGVHAQVVEQAEDGSYGVVKVWNALNDFDGGISQTADTDPVMKGTMIDVEVDAMNIGGAINGVVVMPLDPDEMYVMDSAWGGAMPLTAMQLAQFAAERGVEAPAVAAAADNTVVAIGWEGPLLVGDSMNFGFSTEVTSYSGAIHHSAAIFNASHFVKDLHSGVLEIVDDGLRTVELPLTADTWVNGGDEGTNFDDYAVLTTRTTGLDNILLTFDRSALPEGATIVDATLTVNVNTESGAAGKSLTVLNVDAFDSTTVTYADAPATFNPSAGVPTAIGSLSFDVAAQVGAWEADNQLAIASEGPFGRVSLDSLERYQAKPAMLVVTYSTN